MNNHLTELVFILDRSGSMGALVSDTIGGFNATLQQQKETKGDALVTTVLFDHCYELLHDRIPIQGVAPITSRDYYVRGMTALLDAVGATIHKIDAAHRHTSEALRPGKTVFVIITDGLENASRKYDAEQVRRMISHHQEDEHWEFLFLGANMDAVGTASKLGIPADRAANYVPDSRGTRMAYEAFNCRMKQVREAPTAAAAAETYNTGWLTEVQAYFQKKNGK